MGRAKGKEHPGLPLSVDDYDEFIDDFGKELIQSYQQTKTARARQQCLLHATDSQDAGDAGSYCNHEIQ